MEGLLRVDTSSTFPGSPTNSFIADEVASTCPLLTPSPPTNALVNPLPENETPPNFICAEDLATKLHDVQDDTTEGGDSASSSSSALAEPACTQLLNNHNHYLHITKNEETAAQETGGKTQPLQMTFRNPPENYFFMKWNWPLIRKISTWLFISGLMAMVAIVIAMVWTLPKTCNPPTQWFQGKLMYEIFPASFSDSNGDDLGDLKGISTRIDYLDELGVKTVRLNSIFPTRNYPEDFNNATSLMEIAPQIGNLTDFINLLKTLHSESIYLLLDIPIWPFIKTLDDEEVQISEFNNSKSPPSYEFLQNPNSAGSDAVSKILTFWTNIGVDGFYLKGLERLLEEPNFVTALRRWRKILGSDRVLIVHHDVIEATPTEMINIVMNNVDLIDIRLRIEGGVEMISDQVESVFNSTLFSKPGNPWVHWTLGNVDSIRLTNRLSLSNATLGATLMQLMLPGTPCIFYGDEIGLQQVSDPHEDRIRLQNLHQLGVMVWDYPNKPFTRKGILPWMHSQPTPINFGQYDVISKMEALRVTSPSIYMNALNKDGTNKANAEIKYKENDLLVLQRWYPRRKSYVLVSNFGCVHISADLSTLLYSGEVVVGPTTHSRLESISFKDISLWPGESYADLEKRNYWELRGEYPPEEYRAIYRLGADD